MKASDNNKEIEEFLAGIRQELTINPNELFFYYKNQIIEQLKDKDEKEKGGKNV